jgi:NitT/TauT family transport system permease protein
MSRLPVLPPDTALAISSGTVNPRTAGTPATISKAAITEAVARLNRRRLRRWVTVRASQLGATAASVLAWHVAATLLGDSFLPKPSEVAERLVEWFTVGTPRGPLWIQIVTTLGEAAVGFAIGAVTGAAAGMLLGRTEFLSDVCAPFVRAANAVPRIVLGSLFLILFGLGVTSKIVTVVVMVFFAVFAEAFSSVREIVPDLIDQAYLIGATHRQAVRFIVVPIAKVRILAGLHHAFGLALIGALMGEYIGADRGLGLLIYTSQAMFDVAGIFAGLILTTAIALLANFLLSTVERMLAKP